MIKWITQEKLSRYRWSPQNQEGFFRLTLINGGDKEREKPPKKKRELKKNVKCEMKESA